MKQRSALVRAFIINPGLVILDEPTKGLDPNGIIEMRQLLLKVNQVHHTTIVISSHILEELEKIVGTVGIINKGELISEISIMDIQKSNMNLDYHMSLLEGREENEEADPLGV